jgi:hypothetical protein
MTWTLYKDKEIVIQLSDDFVEGLLKILNGLVKGEKNETPSSAHIQADKILLEFVPNVIKDAWSKATKQVID